MAYRIEFVPAAARDFKRLVKKISNRDKAAIIDAIDQLGNDPRPPDVEKLAGGNSLYRIRRGNFRVVYQIQDRRLIVCIAKVGDRKDVYKNLFEQVRSRLRDFEGTT